MARSESGPVNKGGIVNSEMSIRVVVGRDTGAESFTLGLYGPRADCQIEAPTTPVGCVQAVDQANDWLQDNVPAKVLTLTHLAQNWVVVDNPATLPIVEVKGYSLRFGGVAEGSIWYWVTGGNGRSTPYLITLTDLDPETALRLYDMVEDSIPPAYGLNAYQGNRDLYEATTRLVLDRLAAQAGSRVTAGRVWYGRHGG